MEISLHLKPLPLAAVAVCHLIYCRLSPDCQLSTTNRATSRTKPKPNQTNADSDCDFVASAISVSSCSIVVCRHSIPDTSRRRRVDPRLGPRYGSLRLCFYFSSSVRLSLCLSAAPPIGRVACPPNAAARNNSLQRSADTQPNKLKPNNN